MKKLLSVIFVLALIFALACAPAGENNIPGAPAAGNTGIPSWTTFHYQYDNFGPHFAKWLSDRGKHFPDGGFGGFRTNTAPSPSKTVVVFVHGNSSRAHGSLGDKWGWWKTYEYLRNKGWDDDELYAVNYGFENLSTSNDHRSSFTNKVKDFINEVYLYTGKKVVVVAHSLGVTVTRKAMKDGNLYSKVKRFIAIAGGNHGLPTCGYVTSWGGYYPNSTYPTCSASTGFFHAPQGHSEYGSTSNFIGKLNSSTYGDNEMQWKTTRTYVIHSEIDQLCGVRASYTSNLKGAYATKSYNEYGYGHFGVKDKTAWVQYLMIQGIYGLILYYNPYYIFQ